LFLEEKQDSDFHLKGSSSCSADCGENHSRRYDLIAICNVRGWWPCVPDATLLIVVAQLRWTGGEGEPRRLMKPRSFLLLREDPADLNIKRLRRGCERNPRDTTGRACGERQSMTSMLLRLKDPKPAVTHDVFFLVAYFVTCRRSEMQCDKQSDGPLVWSDKRIDVIRHQRPTSDAARAATLAENRSRCRAFVFKLLMSHSSPSSHLPGYFDVPLFPMPHTVDSSRETSENHDRLAASCDSDIFYLSSQ